MDEQTQPTQTSEATLKRKGRPKGSKNKEPGKKKPPSPRKSFKKKITVAVASEITSLREHNKLSITDIGKIVDLHPSTVYRFLEEINLENRALDDFKGKEADSLLYGKLISRNIRIKNLHALNNRDEIVFSQMTPQQNADLNRNLAIAEGIDTEKERLIRGLSTNNFNVLELTSTLDEVTKSREELRKSLQSLKCNTIEQPKSE